MDKPAIEGCDVKTTLNVEIQDIAEKALLDVLHKQNEQYGGDARTGVVVVMEVETGDIKAMVNMSRADDGDYYELKNNALTDILEPGSTFKTASLLVALDDKKISFNDSVDANRGLYKFGSATMRDQNWNKASAYGVLASLTRITERNLRSSLRGCIVWDWPPISHCYLVQEFPKYVSRIKIKAIGHALHCLGCLSDTRLR